MDLLGSILGKMEKPPSLGNEEKKKASEQQKQFEKIKEKERERLQKYRSQVQKVIHEFIKDSSAQSYKFQPTEKVYRAIVHEVTDVAGLSSFSFGAEDDDRYVMVWKKEFAPNDEELLAYRRGEEWDPAKAKEIAQLKEAEEVADRQSTSQSHEEAPTSNYKDKYERLIGRAAAKDAARATTANKSYGFVPSENKRDLRTIEQVMADSKAKRQKTDGGCEQANGVKQQIVADSTGKTQNVDGAPEEPNGVNNNTDAGDDGSVPL